MNPGDRESPRAAQAMVGTGGSEFKQEDEASSDPNSSGDFSERSGLHEPRELGQGFRASHARITRPSFTKSASGSRAAACPVQRGTQ